jgi:hypothetical protein
MRRLPWGLLAVLLAWGFLGVLLAKLFVEAW